MPILRMETIANILWKQKREGKLLPLLKNDKRRGYFCTDNHNASDTPAWIWWNKIDYWRKGANFVWRGTRPGATLPQVTIPGMTITEIKDGCGYSHGYNPSNMAIRREPVNLKLICWKKLVRVWVFIPDFTIRGIEAMAADTFLLQGSLTLSTVTGNDDSSYW